MLKPRPQLVIADNVIKDDFQRPWRGHAHCCLDQHGAKNDRQGAAIRLDQTTDQAQQEKLLAPEGAL